MGLSGNMKFDPKDGRRIYFELDIIELTNTGFLKVGTWDPDQQIVYSKALETIEAQRLSDKFHNKTFIVSSRLVRNLFIT